MKFCCCVKVNVPEQLEILKSLGYDGCEPSLSAFCSMEPTAAADYKKRMDTVGLECIGFNGLLPGDISLLGEGYDEKKLSEYLENALYRAALAGGKIVTLGSGKARSIPKTMSHSEADDKMSAILSDIFSPIAAKNGVTVAIEPLSAAETNYLNSCLDIRKLVEQVDLKNIRMTLDQYHSYCAGDTNADIASCSNTIVHTHIASFRNNRYYPTEQDAGDLRGFFGALHSFGYNGALCIEGHAGDDFKTAASLAIKTMKQAWE